jgi:acetyl esterase
MLLPDRGRGLHLPDAAHFLSPIEWITPDSPPTLVTSSARDFLYRANLNLADRVRRSGVPLDALFLGREARNARHTWQQNAALAESLPVYARLQDFVGRVTSATATGATEAEAPLGRAA